MEQAAAAVDRGGSVTRVLCPVGAGSDPSARLVLDTWVAPLHPLAVPFPVRFVALSPALRPHGAILLYAGCTGPAFIGPAPALDQTAAILEAGLRGIGRLAHLALHPLH